MFLIIIIQLSLITKNSRDKIILDIFWKYLESRKIDTKFPKNLIESRKKNKILPRNLSTNKFLSS